MALFFVSPLRVLAQPNAPPWDLWTKEVIADIRNRSTLELSVAHHLGYLDVFFTSNPSASWFEEKPPYTEHKNEKIRIHGFLAYPLFGGPGPALVIGHGHRGKADVRTALAVAALGYVAFFIDGPQAGESTGGPKDDNQAWISIDKGPQYGYLYHYAYAGMRALTALEELAALSGNPYRIDTTRFGVLGASMGGIFTTTINAVDDRLKAAIVMASAGNWHHTLRYPNSWLYYGIYTGTRDLPYNGDDPLNSIEDIDTDPTVINFMNYFDPIRYAVRQHAPVLTLIGTHDEYFPLPNANLMLQAMTSAGTRDNFEKRLWLIPNAPHAFVDDILDILSLVPGLSGWLDYAFGERERPLATPKVTMTESGSGLRFEISLAETSARRSQAAVTLHAATRIDSTAEPINDFKSYQAAREGEKFVVQIPAGERSPSGDSFIAGNVIYYAAVKDSRGLIVCSLVYKAKVPMDLSSDFVPTIKAFGSISVPAPPPPRDAAVSVTSSLPLQEDRAYQGMALANSTENVMAVRLEARTLEGRIRAAESLINPVFISLAPRAQRVFVVEEWFGPGASDFNGTFQAAWSDARATSLSFRGNLAPSELDQIGPADSPATTLWLPFASEQDPTATRMIRIFGGAESADVRILFRDKEGKRITTAQHTVPARGAIDIIPASSTGDPAAASVEFQASALVSARLETSGARDTWSIEARSTPQSTRYVLPHTEWNGIFSTRVLAINPSSERRRLSAELRKSDASLVTASPAAFFVEPYSTFSLTVEDAFGIAAGTSGGAGWMSLDAPDGPLIVTALTVDPGTGAAAASSVDAAVQGLWSMPYYVESTGYWTGLAIANPANLATQLTITAYDRSGMQLATTTVTLEAQRSRTQLVYQWIPGLPMGTTGQIVITSNGLMELLAYFGTDDGRSLAAIPLRK